MQSPKGVTTHRFRIAALQKVRKLFKPQPTCSVQCSEPISYPASFCLPAFPSCSGLPLMRHSALLLARPSSPTAPSAPPAHPSSLLFFPGSPNEVSPGPSQPPHLQLLSAPAAGLMLDRLWSTLSKLGSSEKRDTQLRSIPLSDRPVDKPVGHCLDLRLV